MNYMTTTNKPSFNGFSVNNGIKGQFYNFNIILQKLYERMTFMTEKYSKVLFIRFDLRFPKDYFPSGKNDEVSSLFKRLKEQSDYYGFGLQFLWVREQSREKHQHYHCVVLVNGHKARKYYTFLQRVTKAWNEVLGVEESGLVEFCDKKRNGSTAENGIMISRPTLTATGRIREAQERIFHNTFNHCYHWGSYLAKVNQKDNTPKRVRRFGVSQLK